MAKGNAPTDPSAEPREVCPQHAKAGNFFVHFGNHESQAGS